MDSWKAIAAFFGKDERTVKRWEKERGLPVRRLPGAARGTVFAYTEELEQWLSGPQEESSSSDTVEARAEVASEPDPQPSIVPAKLDPKSGDPSRFSTKTLWWAVPLVLVGGFLLYSSLGHTGLHFGKALAAHHPPDSTAQDLYLKGRFYFEKRTAADLNMAVDAFTQAIVHDPGYAEAYVGLADTYNLLREYGTMPTADAEQRARAAAQKAVDLNPNLAEAHTSLAFAEFWGFVDVVDADREFRRAIELDPTSPRAHHWYATFLNQMLRHAEALSEIERARQLDPGSRAIMADKGMLLYDAGRVEESLALLKQLQSADPNFRSAHAYLGAVYWEEHNYAAALEEYREEAMLRHNDILIKDIEAQQAELRNGGAPGLFQYRLAEALKAFEAESGSPFAVASAYGYLRQRDQVMKYLQLARQSHDLGLTNVEMAREFGWLHSDPEFRKLVTDIGFPALP